MKKGTLLFVCSVVLATVAGEEYTGFLDSTEIEKISIPLAGYQTYLVSLESPPNADFDLYVYGPNDSLIGKSMKTNQLDGVVFSTQADDSFRIEVHPVHGAGNYRVSIATLTMEDGYLKEGECWRYLLDLKQGHRCYLLLTPDGCNLDLLVYDRFHYLIAKSESPAGLSSAGLPEELEFRAPHKGFDKYTIEVRARSGSCSYRLLLAYDTKIRRAQ